MSYEYPVGMGPDFIPYNQYNYLCIPKLAMPQLVAEFVKLLELEKTNKFCSCEWVVHPADMGLAEGMRRVRKGEPALDCMVHTKEGFLLGFTHWLFYMRNQEPEPVRVPDIELPPFVISLLTDAERLCNEGKITTKLRDIMWEEQIGYVPTDEQRKAALPKAIESLAGIIVTQKDEPTETGTNIMIHEAEHVYADCPNPWECETHKGFVQHSDPGNYIAPTHKYGECENPWACAVHKGIISRAIEQVDMPLDWNPTGVQQNPNMKIAEPDEGD